MPGSVRLFDIAAMAVLAAIAAIAVFTFRDYGLGWDDYTHAQYGQMLLDFYASGFSDRRALSFVNLYMYGGGFDMAAALLAKLLPFDLFETRRLTGAIVGLIGLFATWRLARHLGGALAGLIALVLLATCPLYYGHMFINPKDAPFAVAMIVLLMALVRVIEEYPRPSPATIVLFGTGLGLSIGSRILAGMAALYVLPPLLLLLANDMREKGTKLAFAHTARFIALLLPGLLLAGAIMALLWPWSVTEPLNLFRALAYFSEFFEKPWKEMFAGQLISVPDMPRSYVPLYFAIQMPEILTLLALGGLGGTVVAQFRSGLPLKRRAVLLLIALAAALPILVPLLTRPAMYNGIRHFIFAVPPLAVLGGLAGAYAIGRLRARSAQIAAGLLIAAGLVIPLADLVRLHPYQYAFFNRASGGIRMADANYTLDYWGLAFKQASKALLAKLHERNEIPPAGRHWRIAVCGPHPPAEVQLGPQFDLTWDPKGADFAMMLGEFYCAELNTPVLVQIERGGVVFARVYDIRDRNISNMFTIPPVTR